MRFLLLTFLTIFSINSLFTSCKKDNDDCDDCGINWDDLKYADDTNKTANIAGPLIVSVRIGSSVGPFAGRATVKLAYTLDSINQEQYFITKTTSDSGYVIFNDLPVDSITKTKTYFANALFILGSDTLSSTNGNHSNGPLEIRLSKKMTRNANLVVTYK